MLFIKGRSRESHRERARLESLKKWLDFKVGLCDFMSEVVNITMIAKKEKRGKYTMLGRVGRTGIKHLANQESTREQSIGLLA